MSAQNNDKAEYDEEVDNTTTAVTTTGEQQKQDEEGQEVAHPSPDLTLPVEPVVRTKRSSLELSQWHAVMAQPEHTSNVAKRWYLKPAQAQEDNPFDTVGQSRPEEPSLLESGSEWTAALTMEGVEAGWYWIVICASFKNMDWSKVFTMIIDATRKSEGQEDWLWTHNSIETTVRSEEFSVIPTDGYVRLRMHRQINLEDIEEQVQIRINLSNEDDDVNAGKVDIHYIELGTNAFEYSGVKDHILYGDGIPDYFITVGADQPSRTKAADIHTLEISDTRNHAVTLHFTPGEAHVNLWDLRAPANFDSLKKKTRPITRPIGQVTFRVSPYLTTPDAMKDYQASIAISSSGSQIVVGSQRDVAHSIPFQVFQMPSSQALTDKDSYQPVTLTRFTETGPTLANYCGLGMFHRIDPSSNDENEERFLVFSGLSLEVYDTKSWSRIYHLELGHQRGDEYTTCIAQSLRGRYFCWNGFKGVISIWNIETGRIASNIYVEEDRADFYAVLNPDQSKVAISVKGTVQVYDTVTGIKLGTYYEGLDSDNFFQVIFEQDYFLVTNRDRSSSNELVYPSVRSVVRVRDMTVMEDHYVHEENWVQYPHVGHVPLFFSAAGSVLNFLTLGDILYPPSEEYACGTADDCPLLERPFEIFYINSLRTFYSQDNEPFTLFSDQTYVSGEVVHILKVGLGADYQEMTDTVVLTLGKSLEHRIFWVQETSQLFLMSEGHFYSWTLSNNGGRVATLDRVIKFLDHDPNHAKDRPVTDMLNIKMCEHACRYRIEIKATSWINNAVGLIRAPPGAPNNILTFPKSAADTFNTTQEFRDEMGILGLIQMYQFSDSDSKDDIIRYLKYRIRPSRENPVSCLVTLCRAWNSDDRSALEKIMAELLPPKYITWIPDPHEDKSSEPLAILLEIAQTRPRVVGVAKVVMKYCVSHANRSRNLAFLSPLFGSMHEVMELYPEEALECMGRIAFIPVKNRAYIIDNHTLALPPRLRLRFWEPRTKPLVKTNDPIMQFHFTGDKADSSNDGFTRPVFMASFDALWFYKDQHQTELKKDGFQAASNTATTTWWKTLYHMFRLKCHVQMPAVVECYDFNLEFFDNPAIAALVDYKWNTIGYTYWLFRFVFQSIFYALVVIAALLQVYYTDPSKLRGLFVVIIIMASVFLWLELLQAVHKWSRYSGSTYNFLDMVAYALPLVGSAIQLKSISDENAGGHTRVLSASVLAVFLHMLFELRIYKQVCKYVIIIQQTVIEIRGFFFIFAGGLFAFAIATQHLLRACPFVVPTTDADGNTVMGCGREATDFPKNFFYAMSATYFFMGGRYDPVSPFFGTQDFAFHAMMIVFFFFTVIVMLNVLIALINVAFTKGDDGWRLAWIESRLRYIESAENMSHNIPGFRQTHNWFPKQIYFSATPQNVRDYQEKYHPGDLGVGREEEDEDDEVDPIFNNVPREEEDEEEGEEQQEEGDEEGQEGEEGEDAGGDEDGDGEGEGEGEQGEEGEADADAEGEAEGEGEDKAGGEETQAEQKQEQQQRPPELPLEEKRGEIIEQPGERSSTPDRLQRKKTQKRKGKIEDISNIINNNNSTSTTNNNSSSNSASQDSELKAQVSELQKQLELQQEQSQRQFDELKELLLRVAKAKK
ncbi:MAG: hypothetical protein J3R72DRAFT_527832 [Linnemannia gamsii]|nr:MAG: hypothetical protein J3R72DRAFT_527832 [Linnemannia gamsii]